MNRKILASAVLAAFGLTANLVAAQQDSQSSSTTTGVGGTVHSATGEDVNTGVGTANSQKNAADASNSGPSGQTAGTTGSNAKTGGTAPVESQVGADPQSAKRANDPSAKARADVVDAPTPDLDAHGVGARGMRGDDDSRERAGLPPYRGPVQRSDPTINDAQGAWAARAAQMNRSMRERERQAYEQGRNDGRNERNAQWRYRADMEAGPSYSSPRYRGRDDWRSDRGWNSADAWADYYQGQDGGSRGDRGWGDMGRSSQYYDFRNPGRDARYDRYSDDLTDRGNRGYPMYEQRAYRGRNGPDDWARNWYDQHRDWFTADRGDGDYRDRGWGDAGRSSEYYDFRDPGPDRNYDRTRDSLRDRNWRQERNARYYDSRRAGRENDAMANSNDGPDFWNMDVRDHAQWNERTYRGTANQGLHE